MGSSAKYIKQAQQKAKYDPDWFCERILRCSNDPWQSEMMNAVADLDRLRVGLPTLFNHKGKKRFTVCAFHGPGKTHFLAKLGHWWNFTREGKIPCTAPKEKQLTTRLWPEFRLILSGAIDEYRLLIHVDTRSIYWAGDVDHCMLAETASNPENLAGYHHKNLMFLVEEASGVRQEMFETVEGALTTEGAIMVLIGNPTKNEGEFYKSHKDRNLADLYYRKKIEHHESNRVDREWVANMARKYGKDSPVFKVRCMGEFVDMSDNQLIALSWLEDARRSWEPDGSHPILKVSGDIADGGEDETVITVALEYQSFTVLRSIHRFSFPMAESSILAAEAMERIAEANGYSQSNGDLLIVDSVGVGSGTAGVLLQKDRYNVVCFKGGSTEGIDTKQYRNHKVRSYLVMRDGFRDGRIIIDEDFCDDQDWEDFTAQMCSVKMKSDDQRYEDIVGKREMKAKGLKSPDMADSPSMVFCDKVPELVPENETVIGTFGTMESAHGAW